MSILQVSLLGVPRLRRDGVVCAVRLRKALSLLSYLAVTGRLHSREELVALLWPEAGDHEGRRVLRSTLSELRRACALSLSVPWLSVRAPSSPTLASPMHPNSRPGRWRSGRLPTGT